MQYDPYRHGVTQGLLTTFMRCREEARNQIEGWTPLATSSALQFGTIAHIVLEHVYRDHKSIPSEDAVLSIISSAEQDYKKERGGRLSPEEAEMMEVNLTLLEAILPEYFKFYKNDFSKMKWAELEEKFSVPSPVKGLNLVGRIDGAYWVRKELWSFESKTKSRIEEDDIQQSLSFDFQNNFYQYALKMKYNARPSGTLYNIIRRPGQRLKQGEPLKAYKLRVLEEIKTDPTHFFIRFEVAVPKADAERFHTELRNILLEFEQWHKGTLATYRNTSACIQKFGPCRFLPKCANNEFSLYRRREDMFPELARP